MPSNPNVTLGQVSNPFIGESIDLTLTFDNTGNADGFGPFTLLYLPTTGTDGADGIDFISANFLGSSLDPVYNQTITADNITDGFIEIEVFGQPYKVDISSSGYVEGDKLVAFELPFGSFVVDQPAADINVTLGGANFRLADLDAPLDLTTQGGFLFGDQADGTPGNPADGGDTRIQTVANTNTGSISPKLVTISKEYLGPEDETATGPNFERQYQLIVDIAEGQTITDLELTDLLPDNMQFVSLDSIVDSSGSPVASSSTSLPSLTNPGGTLSAVIPSVTGGTSESDLVLTFTYYIPRVDSNSAVIINEINADDVNSENQGQISDGNWVPIDDGTAPNDGGDGQADTPVTGIVAHPESGDSAPDHILEDQAIAIQKGVAKVSAEEFIQPGSILEYTLEFQISDYFAFDDIFITDTFSDGQRINPGFAPTIEITEKGSGKLPANSTFAVPTYNPSGVSGDVNNDFFIIDETEINAPANSPDGNGDTKLTFEVSKYLNNQNNLDNAVG
ncbi:MAG: hypothetical protein AAFO76_09945, partial [Cyanobacteria bacterium J06607_15]